jgi:hypothetical protein
VTRLRPAKPLADILENDWDAQLFRGPKALAVQLGWTTYHTLRSRGSKSGYPDRTLVRERIVFAELKREKTGPTAEQVEWLDRLAAAGGEVYLWRPSDLDDVASVLVGRWRHVAPDEFDSSEVHVGPGLEQPGVWWRPASLWIPGVGRADTLNEQQSLLTKGAPQ